MKNMYAVKCLYSYKFYDINHSLLEDITPSWEERIILIKANNIEVYSNIFSAKEKDIKKVLNITYPLGD